MASNKKRKLTEEEERRIGLVGDVIAQHHTVVKLKAEVAKLKEALVVQTMATSVMGHSQFHEDPINIAATGFVPVADWNVLMMAAHVFKCDPVRASLDKFYGALRNGGAPPLVTTEEAIRILAKVMDNIPDVEARVAHEVAAFVDMHHIHYPRAVFCKTSPEQRARMEATIARLRDAAAAAGPGAGGGAGAHD